MSEEALSKHISELIARGDEAPIPENPDVQELTGTVQLARSALTSPTPTEEVETASRDRLVSLMRSDSLLPRELQDVTGDNPSLWARFRLSLYRFFRN